MKRLFLFSILLTFFSSVVFAQIGTVESLYTGITGKKCKELKPEFEGAGMYRGECAGVGGFKLEILDHDARQSINVISPNGKKTELEFWKTVSGAFSELGDKAEWRIHRTGETIQPIALIVRYIYGSPDDPERPGRTSVLVVVKITSDSACITDIIKPARNQNEKARQSADESANKSCVLPL